MHDTGPTLIEAARFVQRFRSEHVVIKLGGELFDRGPVIERLVPQIEVLYRCGLRPVLVHGGGKQIDLTCAKRNIPIEKRAGRRLTSPQVLEVVLEVVARQLNGTFCRLLRERGLAVHGFADGVAAAVRCRRRPALPIDGELVDFGQVGDVLHIDAEALAPASSDHYVMPVLPSVGTLEDGSLVNVNADSVAARIALALSAQKLVMLSRVAGVMESTDAAGPISQLTVQQARELLTSPRVTGGMHAKLEEALAALDGGVTQVHIISGVEPQTLLREIFTEEGCGTLISNGR